MLIGDGYNISILRHLKEKHCDVDAITYAQQNFVDIIKKN